MKKYFLVLLFLAGCSSGGGVNSQNTFIAISKYDTILQDYKPFTHQFIISLVNSQVLYLNYSDPDSVCSKTESSTFTYSPSFPTQMGTDYTTVTINNPQYISDCIQKMAELKVKYVSFVDASGATKTGYEVQLFSETYRLVDKQ